jgi:hypothetical protein
MNWICESNVQVIDGVDKGGVYAWIDEESNRGSFLYSETTGYLISLIRNVSYFDEDANLLKMARSAADWLLRVAQYEDGLLLSRKYCGPSEDKFSFDNKNIGLFDNCIAAYGLLGIYRMTDEDRYLQQAENIANACLDHFFDKNLGLLGAIFDGKKKCIRTQSNHWSLHSGSFLLKCALMFVELSAARPKSRYQEAVNTLIDLALDKQLASGAFRTSKSSNQTHLHPHTYTVEALLYLGHEWRRADLLESAKCAIDFSFTNCLNISDGVWHSWPTPDNYCGAILRSDVIAQSLRAYYIARLVGIEFQQDWESLLLDLHDLLDSFTLAAGGTSYGLSNQGILIQHANSWCHFFRIEMELFRYCYENQLPLPGNRLVIT